jgi:hypothetical protein
MTYHQAFDRLGRPVARRSRQPIGHTVLQTIGWAVFAVCLAVFVWVR